MHYKNGREAKNGDKIMIVPTYPGQAPVVGVLYDAVPGVDSCNGKLVVVTNYVTPNLRECLHVDDALALLNGVKQP